MWPRLEQAMCSSPVRLPTHWANVYRRVCITPSVWLAVKASRCELPLKYQQNAFVRMCWMVPKCLMDIREVLEVFVVGLVHFRIQKYWTLCTVYIACTECAYVRIIVGPVFDSKISWRFLFLSILPCKRQQRTWEYATIPSFQILSHFSFIIYRISISIVASSEI
jgi:hypothetical protein